MLDPDWTPERGYAHALGLLRIAELAEARIAAELALDPDPLDQEEDPS